MRRSPSVVGKNSAERSPTASTNGRIKRIWAREGEGAWLSTKRSTSSIAASLSALVSSMLLPESSPVAWLIKIQGLAVKYCADCSHANDGNALAAARVRKLTAKRCQAGLAGISANAGDSVRRTDVNLGSQRSFLQESRKISRMKQEKHKTEIVIFTPLTVDRQHELSEIVAKFLNATVG